MSQDFIALFKAAYEASQRAFNDGDYDRAFAAFSADVEYHPLPVLPEAEVMRGREEVERFFAQVRETIYWKVEPQEYNEPGGSRVIVHLRGTSVGRVTRIESTIHFYEVIYLGDDGLVQCVQDYERWEDALDAVWPSP